MSGLNDEVRERLKAEGAAGGFDAGLEFAGEIARRREEVEQEFQTWLQTQKRGPAQLQQRALERVDQLKVEEEARRLLAAEKERSDDLDELYIDREALKHLPMPEPLIPGVLPRHAYGVLRGRDQSFKSFVALDWALTLATGRLWMSHPVEKVSVLYIAGEGAWGLSARVAAWEQSRKASVPDEQFTVRQTALNLHRPGPAFDHLLDHVHRRGYGLVIVDTLRRVAGGADGNSSEMGAVVDNLDRIKQATAGGTVLAVAHTDKGDNDSRGYSGIEDDADFVWHARREDLDLDLELVKMKDGPDGQTIRLTAQPVDQSIVLFPAGPATANREATTNETKLLDTLVELFPEGASNTELLSSCGVPKATYYRARKALVQKGLVAVGGTETRPRYVPTGVRPVSRESQGLSPAIAAESHHVSQGVSPVSPVSRPLGSETVRPETLSSPTSAGVSDDQAELLARLTSDPSSSSDTDRGDGQGEGR